MEKASPHRTVCYHAQTSHLPDPQRRLAEHLRKSPNIMLLRSLHSVVVLLFVVARLVGSLETLKDISAFGRRP